jgi:hypothetical protein
MPSPGICDLMRWHYADPPLLWLYPVTYVVHIAEELWMGQGYVHWMRSRGSRISEELFVVGNAVGLMLMISGTWLATHRPRYAWIAVALAFAVLLNTVDHLTASFASATYSPGLGSAVVLWIPLGLLTLVRAWYQASRREWWGGLCATSLIHVVTISVSRGWFF